MNRGPSITFALAGTALAILAAAATYAQLPRRIKNCLPYPTLADEIQQAQEEIEAARPKVHVVQVVFDGADGLPSAVREEMAKRFKKLCFNAGEDWPLFGAEYVRQRMQDYGFFEATLRPEARILHRSPKEVKAAVSFHVIPGRQYRLGQVEFLNSHVVPIRELRKQVLLRDGDIFDLSKLRLGLNNLIALYGAHGYINFVAIPDVQVDKARRRISITLRMDEGYQFRVGKVQILGLDREVSSHALKVKIQPGMIFSPQLVKDFYDQNRLFLPADASPKEDTTIVQNARDRTVAVSFDLRGCP